MFVFINLAWRKRRSEKENKKEIERERDEMHARTVEGKKDGGRERVALSGRDRIV